VEERSDMVAGMKTKRGLMLAACVVFVAGVSALLYVSSSSFGGDANRQSSTVGKSDHDPTDTCFPSPNRPWKNTLGMRFMPVPHLDVLFGVWLVRVHDFQQYATAKGVTWVKPSRDWVQGPTHPAIMVSWYDAQGFCEWLTEKERAEGQLRTYQKYRLSTDAEWSVAVGLNEPWRESPEEKAFKIKDVYPWGNQWPPPEDAGRYGPVGRFAPNKYGLYDMGGNVRQWCDDYYKYGGRVVRGFQTGFLANELYLSSARGNEWGSNRGYSLGFRCVLTVLDERAQKK
jgi:hypothetical protein